MKSILKLLLLFFSSLTFSQTNLLETSTWTVGTGSAPGFNRTGVDAENIREMGTGPHGTSVLLWKTIPEATGNTGAGGWTTDRLSIDHTKTYRFTVWIKKTNSNDGATYFGPKAFDASGDYATNYLSGAYISHPYFWAGDVPTLNEWYLLVGYLHHSTYTTTTHLGGVYKGSTGEKVLDNQDYKFESDAIEMNETIFLSANTNISDSQFYYAPTIYDVNGQEPSIEELIDIQSPTAPTLSSTSQTDTSVALSWTAATDNIAVTSYKVYNGGVLVTTLGNVLSYEIIGLTASTAYTFTVTALDAAGNESIGSNTETITTNPSSGGGSGYWSLNNQNVYYTNGNVGIGTSIPDSKLTVKGTIHSEEVKIDLSVPAPDYVFETDYNLTSLDKLQKYIKTHGHLPNIPSAKEMETHGIELGIMNMKLLEKIEELTLYMLMQESRIKALEKNTNNNK